MITYSTSNGYSLGQFAVYRPAKLLRYKAGVLDAEKTKKNILQTARKKWLDIHAVRDNLTRSCDGEAPPPAEVILQCNGKKLVIHFDTRNSSMRGNTEGLMWEHEIFRALDIPSALRLLKLLDKLVVRLAHWQPKDEIEFQAAKKKIRGKLGGSRRDDLIELLRGGFHLVPEKDGWAIAREICGGKTPLDWLLNPEKIEPARRKLLIALAGKIPE